MLPIVTAIIPCRNHVRYVPQRLASVLGQTMPRLEVLFLDDDSTDGSDEAAIGADADTVAAASVMTFDRLAVSLRLAQTLAPGLLRLHEVVLSARDGRTLAPYAGKTLGRLRPGGTAVALAVDETGLLLWSYGNDPWLVVPAPQGVAGGQMRLDVLLTGYSLTPGSAPLPGFWPSSGS